jgi:hypothetical protein
MLISKLLQQEFDRVNLHRPTVARAPTNTACWMTMAATLGATQQGH